MTYIFLKIGRQAQIFENGRQFQFFGNGRWSKYFQMKEDLIFFWNGRRPQYSYEGKTTTKIKNKNNANLFSVCNLIFMQC